jgi:hypothetical protein
MRDFDEIDAKLMLLGIELYLAKEWQVWYIEYGGLHPIEAWVSHTSVPQGFSGWKTKQQAYEAIMAYYEQQPQGEHHG